MYRNNTIAYNIYYKYRNKHLFISLIDFTRSYDSIYTHTNKNPQIIQSSSQIDKIIELILINMNSKVKFRGEIVCSIVLSLHHFTHHLVLPSGLTCYIVVN